MREIVYLACSECKRKNYVTTRRRDKKGKLEIKKYCKFCHRHTLHRGAK